MTNEHPKYFIDEYGLSNPKLRDYLTATSMPMHKRYYNLTDEVFRVTYDPALYRWETQISPKCIVVQKECNYLNKTVDAVVCMENGHTTFGFKHPKYKELIYRTSEKFIKEIWPTYEQDISNTRCA